MTLRRGTANVAVRLLPAVVVWSLCVLVLTGYDTGLVPVLRYSLFLGLGVMLPGTLLWRWLRGNADGFAADVAFGTGLGLAISVLVYIPARAVGLPLLVLVFPLATVVAFSTRPLRRHWHSRAAPMPAWWSWSVAAACMLGLAVIIAGELRHHMPGEVPYVTGEALRHHWFTHAYLASASWQSGVELDLLLRRMLPVTATVGAVFGVAVLAGRLARRPWAGPVAGILLVLTANLDVYGWNGTASVTQTAFSTSALMYLPTHAFAILVAVPAIWLIAVLLRDSKGGRRVRGWQIGAWNGPAGSWLLLGVQLVALSGTTPTTLPTVAAASGLVLVAQLLRRRVDRTAFLLSSSAVVMTAFVQLAPFGTEVAPLRTFRDLAPRLGFADESLLAVVICALTLTVSWFAIAAGMVGFAWARAWRDPAAVFLIGYLIAALGAASLLYEDGLGFVRGAVPVAAAGSAWGLAVLLSGPLRDSGQQVPARRLVLGSAAFGTGAAVAWALGAVTADPPRGSDAAVAWSAVWPWLTAVVVAVVLGGLASVLLRMSPARWRMHGAPARGLAVGVAAAVLLGTAAIGTPVLLAEAVTDPPCVAECADARRTVPDGGAAAARYVRGRSDPDELLATNSHCVPQYGEGRCDVRNFWLAAYAETRVLIEGWADPPTGDRNQALLAANDAVFRSPTAAGIDLLRDRYNVRWLVSDKNVNPIPPNLERLLPKRFESGSVVVFEIPRQPDGKRNP